MKTFSTGNFLKTKIAGGLLITLGFLTLSVITYLLTNNKISLFYNDGYKPDQPLPFSHKLHAGEYKIDCLYCHAGVEVSHHSPIPSLEVCMNCHRVVKTESPWIQKLQEAYVEGKSIPWQKVHLLPDFVRFSHSPHILAGKECRACHGPVEEMEKVYQFQTLSMGFCVNCHRKPLDKSMAFSFVKKEGEDYKHSNELKSKETSYQAPVDCKVCHY